MTTAEKKNRLRRCKMGDVILCTNGHEYEFVRMKQAKFIGKRRGVAYDIHIEMFVEVVKESEEIAFDPHTLREGDLLYILNSKQEAVIYKFKYMINADRVMATNPITGTGVRIPSSLVKGAVLELAAAGGR